MATDYTLKVQQDPLYAEALEQARLFVRDYLLNKYPYLDLEPTRVLNDVLVEPGAAVNAYDEINAEYVRRQTSLLEIEQDPELASDLAVDRILSNFRTSRREGATASGPVTIFLSSNSTISIPAGEIFTAGALSFVAPIAYVGTVGNITTESERPLTDLGNGVWAMTITVEAAEDGAAYNIRQGTQITWTTPVSSYINSRAEADFSGGEDTQTNASLIEELNDGLTAKVMAGRQNIQALIKAFAPTTRAISCIGFGDPEMLRNSHNMFGLKIGGKADIYVRTDSKPYVATFEKSCTLIDEGEKIFQTLIGRDEFPGFYEIAAIRPLSVTNFGGSLEIVQELRSVDLSELSYVLPEIINITEGAYTRYQVVSVQFRDPTADSSLVAGDTAQYQLDLLGLPLIADIQDHIASRGVRTTLGDYLVRAPIPMQITVSMEIQYVMGDQDVDTAAVQKAVVDTINDFGFNRASLPVSLLVDAAQEVLEDRATVKSPVSLSGRLRLPDGTIRNYRTTSQLELPKISEQCASSRTIGIYTDYERVAVSVEQVETLPV